MAISLGIQGPRAQIALQRVGAVAEKCFQSRATSSGPPTVVLEAGNVIVRRPGRSDTATPVGDVAENTPDVGPFWRIVTRHQDLLARRELTRSPNGAAPSGLITPNPARRQTWETWRSASDPSRTTLLDGQ
jgi:hypothetical protein